MPGCTVTHNQGPYSKTQQGAGASHAPAQIFIDLDSHDPRKAWPESLRFNHKDVGVGHRRERRKWNLKKSVLKKITLCKPEFCEPSACNSEMLCYSAEVAVNRGSVSSCRGLCKQNMPGRAEGSLPEFSCEQNLQGSGSSSSSPLPAVWETRKVLTFTCILVLHQ